MIITRTPLRISFAGGGTDFEDYYKAGYGAVVSAAVNKFIYITVNRRFDNTLRVSYSKTEITDEVKDIQHDIVREALNMTGITGGLEITSIADIPAGTGMGSSSSFAVGLLNALFTFTGRTLSSEDLAQYACKLEIEALKHPIGKQDQYAAAYGGINYFRFNPDGGVDRSHIFLGDEDLFHLEHKLILFFLGTNRDANSILAEQKADIPSRVDTLNSMRAQADTLADVLSSEGFNEKFAYVLQDGWLMKKTLTGKISNGTIDDYYQKALDAGALGGKLLGAGGGGFLLIYCDPQHRDRVKEALGLRSLQFRVCLYGSQVVFFA
jgi:D-glycero-alpha-D-manno-heptose-7-phosphate kinase